MSKITCEFDGKKVECKVVENMGYQGGYYVKCVKYEGKERIVIRKNGIWGPQTPEERFGGFCGSILGMNK